jgi:hypothetical protein
MPVASSFTDSLVSEIKYQNKFQQYLNLKKLNRDHLPLAMSALDFVPSGAKKERQKH